MWQVRSEFRIRGFCPGLQISGAGTAPSRQGSWITDRDTDSKWAAPEHTAREVGESRA